MTTPVTNVYAITSFTVSRRTREIGVRVTLVYSAWSRPMYSGTMDSGGPSIGRVAVDGPTNTHDMP